MYLCEECITWDYPLYSSIGPEAPFHHLKHGNVIASLNEHILHSQEQSKFPSFC